MDVSRYSEEIDILKPIAIVVVIIFLMTTLHYSTPINESDPAVIFITLLGFMLILSYNVGKILSRFRLPKLTIYIITGILCGPYVTGFVSQEVVGNLKFVDNLAGEQTVLFIIGVAFMSYELATFFHYEVLLLGVTAGFCVQNFSKQGEMLINHTEESMPVVYPVSFSIAGAKLSLIDLVISVVGINQIIGPIFFKYALDTSGEISDEAWKAPAETLIRPRLGDTVDGTGSPLEEEKTVKES